MKAQDVRSQKGQDTLIGAITAMTKAADLALGNTSQDKELITLLTRADAIQGVLTILIYNATPPRNVIKMSLTPSLCLPIRVSYPFRELGFHILSEIDFLRVCIEFYCYDRYAYGGKSSTDSVCLRYALKNTNAHN